jgi:hypothetical protein
MKRNAVSKKFDWAAMKSCYNAVIFCLAVFRAEEIVLASHFRYKISIDNFPEGSYISLLLNLLPLTARGSSWQRPAGEDFSAKEHEETSVLLPKSFCRMMAIF